LGIAALVIGVFSFFICWVPFLGIAVSALGLLLGLGGLVLAIVRRGSGVGFSIAGSGLSAISLAICLAWTLALSGALKEEKADSGPKRTPEEAARKAEEEYDADGLVLLLKTVQIKHDGLLPEISGTVVNRRPRALHFVSIELYLYDESGAQVDTALAVISGLERGGRWNFKTHSFKDNVRAWKVAELSGR
jgi:hypothetical protein